MKKTKTTFARLAEKIKQDLNIDVVVSTMERTRAGIHMRASGAWVWCGKTSEGLEIGSGYTATELLRAEKLGKTTDRWNSCAGIEILPN